MSSIYKRGGIWWAQYFDAAGDRQRDSTTVPVGETAKERRANREKALQVAELLQGAVDEEKAAAAGGPVTVAAYAKTWLSRRRRQGLVTVRDDEARIRDHILPALGRRPMAEVRRADVLALVRDLMDSTTLAPRTVLHVYGVLRVMFSDAVADEVVDATPCTLKQRRGELPEKVDKDPTWRSGAIYRMEEARRLCTDPSIPELRRVTYAMAFFTGMRVGEVVMRRWSDLDRTLEPLAGLTVASQYSTRDGVERATKTRNVRRIPVHPELARVLAAWKLSGWAAEAGRPPMDGDLIICPAFRRGSSQPRSSKRILRALHRDCERLGLRPRRTHDTKRTFITWARDGGAQDAILKWISHGPTRSSILDVYSEHQWPSLCRQVLAIKLDLPVASSGTVLQFPSPSPV